MRLGFYAATLVAPALFAFRYSPLKFAMISAYEIWRLRDPISFIHDFCCCVICRVRGTLSAVFVLAANVGGLFGFVIANYFDFVQQAIISMFFPILFFVVFAFVPETPTFLQRRNKTEVSDNNHLLNVHAAKSHSHLSVGR